MVLKSIETQNQSELDHWISSSTKWGEYIAVYILTFFIERCESPYNTKIYINVHIHEYNK
jgi:hypothetical protein